MRQLACRRTGWGRRDVQSGRNKGIGLQYAVRGQFSGGNDCRPGELRDVLMLKEFVLTIEGEGKRQSGNKSERASAGGRRTDPANAKWLQAPQQGQQRNRDDQGNRELYR